MSDEIASGSAWGGVAPAAQEQSRPRATDARSPLDRRALEDAMILSGSRGNEDQRAVRVGELNALVDSLAGELTQQFRAPIRELGGIIADPALLFRNAGLSAPEIVDALPNFSNFPGRLVFLTTDNKLYRWTGTEWTAAVPAVDITGQLAKAQIASEVTAEIAAAQAEAEAADAKASAVRSDHDALVDGFTGTLSAAFSGVSTDLAGVQSAIEQDVATLQSAVDASVASLTSDISSLQAATSTSIGALDTELATVNADLASIIGDLTDVQTDISAVYDGTTGQVKASALAGYYTNTQADAAIAADVSSLEATILTPAGQVRSTLLTGYYTRADTDAAVSAAVTSLEAEIDGVSASVTDEAIARASGDTAEANARQSLATQLRGTYSGTDIANVQTGLIHSERQARITSDSNLQSQINTIVAASSGDFGDLFAAIEEESTARITADSALAGNFSDLTARLDNVQDANGNPTNKTVEATLSDDRIARANADAALSGQITSLSATVQSNNTTLSAAITSASTASADADAALATDIEGLEASLNGVSANLSTNYYTRAGTDTAIATAQTALQASIDGVSSNLSTNYLTSTETNAAISSLQTNLQSQIDTGDDNTASALAAAQAASTLAGSKGKVLVQGNAPATADRLAQNLWIDTTSNNNTPKRWNGSAWVAVTDKAAIDAATAAAAAQTTANAISANLSTNYYTKTATDGAIAAAETSLASSIGGVAADLAANYYTNAATDAAIAAESTSLQAQIGSVQANLNTESAARVSEDTALSSQITSLTADLGSLSASVTENYLTTTQTNQAIAASTTTIGASIDSLSATVTQQGSSIATLEGNASAGYLIKAQAGGQVSLLDLIAADGVSGAVSVAKISATNIILDGSVTAASLGVGSVTADKIATNAVTAEKVTAGAITTEKIDAGAITADKLAANSVTANSIAANTITGGLLATSGIITQAAQIGEGVVGRLQIQNSAVSGDKISVNNLREITDSLGSFSNQTTGGRVVIEDTGISVFDANNVLRVRLGLLE